MTTRDVTLEGAWTLLSKASQDSNMKLSMLADRVLQTGTLQDAPR
jgi:hypothetical protein